MVGAWLDAIRWGDGSGPTTELIYLPSFYGFFRYQQPEISPFSLDFAFYYPTIYLIRALEAGTIPVEKCSGSREKSMQERGSAVDQVVVQIRNLIRDRSLTVGDTLPSEAELSAMFGAGRNTVREAMRTLRTYGAVEPRQKVGAVITNHRQSAVAKLFSVAMDISSESFRDIQGYRRLTEMNLFASLMQSMTEEDLQKMEDANAQMIAAEDVAGKSHWDYRFHKAMVEAAQNSTLSELYEMLEPVICRLMEVGKSQHPAVRAAASEHEAIVRALRARSGIDFAYHMNRHLDAGLDFLPDSARVRDQAEN